MEDAPDFWELLDEALIGAEVFYSPQRYPVRAPKWRVIDVMGTDVKLTSYHPSANLTIGPVPMNEIWLVQSDLPINP